MTPQDAADVSPRQAPAWHTLSVEQAIDHLATRLTGLDSAEATRRMDRYGPNELQTVDTQSAWRTFVAQFQNALILILLGATAVSGFLGHTLEAIVITVIVLFAVLLGFIQEHRAGRALEALRRMGAPSARALRDGQESVLPARELVPGDVVLLRAGDRVPADARVTDAISLAVDEAALTGESAPVQKTSGAPRRCRSFARRSHQHDLRRHARRPGSRTCRHRRDRHVNGVRAHRDDGGNGRGRSYSPSGQSRSTGLDSGQSSLGRRGACRTDWSRARPSGARDVPVRHRAGRRGGSRGPARSGHDLIGDRRATDGEASMRSCGGCRSSRRSEARP